MMDGSSAKQRVTQRSAITERIPTHHGRKQGSKGCLDESYQKLYKGGAE
jgi:hypothetical protein